MLRLDHVSIVRGARTLYENATALASDGERVALVGENGCGKSSLFAAILGELSPADGEIEAPNVDRIAHVAQSVVETDLEALEYVLQGHAPLIKAKAELANAQATNDDLALAHATTQLAELNEGAIRAQAQTILAGLGFFQSDMTRAVRDFSGGWRNRLSLARALMRPSDLLLLDEPTNHLDMDSLIWLEAWLKRLNTTVLIISHDREFLDRTTTTTWAIENGTLTRYGGNYSFYEMQRVERLKQQMAAHKAYERQAQHLKDFIERFRYKATKARQAQSRIKMLDRLEAVEPVRAATQWRFQFATPEKMPDLLVRLDSVSAGYTPEVSIVGKVNFEVRSGDRIGVLGVNGAGKSTLIKTIVGDLPALGGEITRAQHLVVGYFAQHQLESLDGRDTPIEVFKRKLPLEREQTLRDYLGRFRFPAHLIDTKISQLSGGEKARLALALIVWDKPNLLVLDEPTNHLDMATREALTMALAEFEGALLLVSHDRHLIRNTCETLVLVHDKVLQPFDGDLDDYTKLVLEYRKTAAKAERETNRTDKTSEANEGSNRKTQRRNEALLRNRIAQLKKPFLAKLKKVEDAMAEIQAKLTDLDRQMADESWYATATSEVVAQATRTRGELANQLESLEMDWLTLSEEIEACATRAQAEIDAQND